jgi:predicted Fe-Mo cluster-binding NifX family protein
MTDTLRIAVPTNGEGGLDAPRSGHFGHADSFTIVEVSGDNIVGAEAIANGAHQQGGCGATVAMLAQAGASAAIVVGMGGGPLNAMQRFGMVAYQDVNTPTPRQAVEAFLGGYRVPFGGEHVCQGHH